MVMPIAEDLWSGGMMEWELYCKIRAANTNQEKMRELYEVLHSGGDKVKSAFYSRLEKHVCLEQGSVTKARVPTVARTVIQ